MSIRQTQPSASMPFIITQADEARLRDLGHAQESIDKMSPQQAQDILAEPPFGFFQSIAVPLARKGLKVIPVKGKVAFIPNHPGEATTDIAKILGDWEQYADCNAAVMCLQEPGGVVILDDDGKVDLAALYTFETGEPAPCTRRIVNREIEDGKPFRSHWIFAQTPETIALPKNIAEGMTAGEFSLRVKNFYAVGEGSIHPEHKGRYHAVTDVPIIPMPPEFLEWLVARANKYSATGDFTKKPEGWIYDPIFHHDINNGLTRIGGWYMQHKNIDDGNVLADILIGHAENQAVHADGVTPYPINRKEIETIAQGLCSRYKTGEQKKKERDEKARNSVIINGVLGGSADWSVYDDPEHVENTFQAKLNALHAQGKSLEEICEESGFNALVAESLQKTAEETARAAAAVNVVAATAEITDEVLDAEFPAYDGIDVGPIPTLIEGFLPKGANFFGSLSGVGKTWLGLSVARALTSGDALFGVFPVKEKVAVLYLIPEASNATFKNRMKLMHICKDKKLFRYRTISQGVTLKLTDPKTIAMIQKLRCGGRR